LSSRKTWRRCTGAGIAVLTTLERPEDAAVLLAWDVDALESDDPAMVVAAVRRLRQCAGGSR